MVIDGRICQKTHNTIEIYLQRWHIAILHLRFSKRMHCKQGYIMEHLRNEYSAICNIIFMEIIFTQLRN